MSSHIWPERFSVFFIAIFVVGSIHVATTLFTRQFVYQSTDNPSNHVSPELPNTHSSSRTESRTISSSSSTAVYSKRESGRRTYHIPPTDTSPQRELTSKISENRSKLENNFDAEIVADSELLKAMFKSGREGNIVELDSLLSASMRDETVRKRPPAFKNRICIVQTDNRVETPTNDVKSTAEVRISRTSFYRYALRYNYTYTYSTCHGSDRAFVIGKLCGFGMQDIHSGAENATDQSPSSGRDHEGCDYVFYLDTDTLLKKGSIRIEDIIRAHFKDFRKDESSIPTWIGVVGVDHVHTILQKAFVSHVNVGELLVNCRHSQTEEFLRFWSYGASYDDDQQIFGILKEYFAPFRDKISIDLTFLGLYGRLTYHYAGAKKHLMPMKAERLAMQFSDDGELTELRLKSAVNRNGSKIYSICPVENTLKRSWSEDVNDEDLQEFT